MSLLSKINHLSAILDDAIELSIFKRAGGVTIVGNRSMSEVEIGDKIDKAARKQGVARAFDKIASKLNGEPRGRFSDLLKESKRRSNDLNGTVTSGTVARGRKGKRVYVSRDMARTGELRDVAHHEKFHNIPIIGESEIGAHFYGGLRSKKGKMSFKKGISRIGHLAKTRPSRFAIEAGAIAAGALGARKALRKRDRDAAVDQYRPK